MKVFVCSEYGGKWDNILSARKYCSWTIAQGHAPFAPHLLYTQFLSEEPLERQLGLDAGLQYLACCDEMWVFSIEGELSSGMNTEIKFALEEGIPIRWLAVEGDVITMLKHLPADRVPSHKDLLTDSSFTREVNVVFSCISADLHSGHKYSEYTVLLDKLLDTELPPRDERVEAEWVLALQGEFDE